MLLDVSTRQRLGEITEHPAPIRSIAYSPDGDRFVTAGESTRMWDGRSGAPLDVRIDAPANCHEVSYSPEGSKLLLACGQDVLLLRADTGSRLTDPVQNERFVTPRISPGGEWFVTAWQNSVFVRDASTGAVQGAPLVHPDEVAGIQISPDGRMLATVTGKGVSTLWNRATGKPVGSLNAERDQPDVSFASFSPEGDRVVTTSQDDIVRVWRLGDEPQIELSMTEAGVSIPAEFTADGKLLIASSGGGARVWDSATGEPLAQLKAADGSFHIVSLSPDGHHLVASQPAASGPSGVLWTMNDVLFASTEDATSFACREHLNGAGRITVADASAAPILIDRASENVCAEPTFLSRLHPRFLRTAE